RLGLLLLLVLLILLRLGLLLLVLLILLRLGLLLLLVLLILLALGLFLLLFRLGLLLLFRSIGVLFVLILLCVRGSKASEKKEQKSRTDKTNSFHDVASITAIQCAPRSLSLARLLFSFHRLSRLWFIPNCLRPDVHPGQRMKDSKDIEKPQDHRNHNDRVQNGLDRSLHRYEAVDQPEQNAHYG
ncbi:MAG TPA: hypothetical protein VN822_10635, partial [Candidatus Acidoferrales bacterium]|nr:hypothetical protein [Candidatus Acidoferrales bacterium]